MPIHLEPVQLLIDRLRAFIPNNVDEKSFLSDQIYDRMAASNRSTPMRPMGIVGVPITAEQTYAAALQALEHLDQPAALAAQPEGIVGLATLAWENRPALPLQDGCFQPLAVGPWQQLVPNLIQRQARSICRLDLCTGGALYCQLGTGFVVGTDAEWLLIMTNTHVVDAAIQMGWPALPGLTLTCDFARETVLTGGPRLPVEPSHQSHTAHDLTLLTLRSTHFGATPPPPPLPLAADVRDNAVDMSIGVIGHPALNTQRDGAFPIHYGFGNAFGIKRFAPGLVRARAIRSWYHKYPTVDAIFHDATTLGGNSGSCLLDLQSGLVVGLHFGGWPMPQQNPVRLDDQTHLATLFYDNGAVPLWTLVADPLLAQINFV